MANLTNFITTSRSNPRGLAYVAYGDPERYAQVKNQIREEVDLGSSKLRNYSKELIEDCIFNSFKRIINSSFNKKYSFIADSDIKKYSSKTYIKIILAIDSISSYSDSIKEDLSLLLTREFIFINKNDSIEIINLLFQEMKGPNTPIEALGFVSDVEAEAFNDLTKLDSLPPESVIPLKASLNEEDFMSSGQTIFAYENDYLKSISNLADLIPNSIKNLIGYPTDSIEDPAVNGDDSQNLKDSSFNKQQSESTLFTNSIANLNLVAALNYDPNKDPFNTNEGSIYNLTPSLNIEGKGLLDSNAELGSAFREKA